MARGVVCRVICKTAKILLTHGPISDLGECPRTEHMGDDAAVAEALPAAPDITTSKETC